MREDIRILLSRLGSAPRVFFLSLLWHGMDGWVGMHLDLLLSGSNLTHWSWDSRIEGRVLDLFGNLKGAQTAHS